MPEVDISWQLKYCRTCASELGTGVDIFGNEGKRLGISEKLRKTLSVLVLEEDLLPKRICVDCCTSLEEFSQYKETVFDAQIKLKGIATSLSSTTKKEEISLPVPSASASSPTLSTVNTDCKDCGKSLGSLALCLETHHEAEDSDAVEGEPIADTTEDVPVVVPPEEIQESRVIEEPGVPNFPCDFCDDIFDDASRYYHHIATTHKGKRYHCSLCSLSYAQKASLTVHIRTHHSAKESLPPKTHICDFLGCSAAFFDKKDLTRHSKVHKTEREFPCYICNKFYKTSKCLAKHISTHLSANKFVCTICQKGFNRKNRLAEHENTHSTSSLGCPFCTKTFNNYPNYSKHIRRMHENMVLPTEKLPPPIKNAQVDKPVPSDSILQTTQVQVTPPSSTTVTAVWVDASPVSRQSFSNMNNSLEVVSVSNSGLQSNSSQGGNVSGLSTTSVDNSNVREVTPAHDPNQPMELCYKITSTDFQDMPMELTKVFQESGPLELCVRTETELSHFIEASSNSNKEPHNFNTKLDLIDLSNVAPFQQQPMDLINRDSYCCNLTSVNNSMDLSLRSSFSDQSANSFIRELLDLSSRSEAYHHDTTHTHNQNGQMELNLTCSKHPQPYRSVPAPAPSHSSGNTNTFLNAYSDNLF